MITLYLDNCCYSRPFDDLKQEKINFEATAIESIFTKNETKELKIYKSKAIDYEISKIRDNNKRRQIEDLYDAINMVEIPYSSKVKKIEKELENYNIKYMDALHIAFAESAEIDYFITTDKLLINASKRANLNINVMNPVEFIMEVM